MKKYFAEMLGTMVLVLMGCGSAVFVGVADTAGVLSVAFAFGLAVVAMAYCIGGISGCHINPAITLGVWLSKRMSGKEAVGYMSAQFVGALIGSAILYGITVSGVAPGGLFDVVPTGANAYGGNAVELISHFFGEEVPTSANALVRSGLLQALLAETIFTFVFVLVVLGATDSEKGAGKRAGLVIGLTLVLVHIVCIRITGTSVNPARSFGPAIFAGGEALSQLWVFIVAPFVGGALAAGAWKMLTCKCEKCCEKK